MTATITLLPTTHDPHVAEWAQDMDTLGYDVVPRELYDGTWVNTAVPREAVHTNANVARMIHRKRQYGHGITPSGGPDGGAAA